MSTLVVRQVVEVIADELTASRRTVLSACDEHGEIASLSRWFARQAADVLWGARLDLSDVPVSQVWHHTDTSFLLSPLDESARGGPPAADRHDLWIEALAIPPDVGAIEAAANAIRVASARLALRRARRRAGTFVLLVAVMIRGGRDLAIELAIGAAGEPDARAHFRALDADGGLRGELLAWQR